MCQRTTFKPYALQILAKPGFKKIPVNQSVFVTNSDFLIPTYLQPDDLILRYLKLRLFGQTVYSLKYLRYQDHSIAKLYRD